MCTRDLIWVEPSHFRLDESLHKMADLEVSRQLALRKINIYLVVMRSSRFVSFKINSSKVQTLSIPIKFLPVLAPLLYALTLVLYLPLSINKLSPKAVMVAPDVSVISYLPSLIVAKMRRAKFILDVRTVPVERLYGFRGFLQKFWFNVSILVGKQLFDGITVITELMKTDLCSQYGLKPEKVGVWTSGVSTTLFDPQRNFAKARELKTELGLSEKFVVFYHGVFTATRGLKETIYSMKKIKNERPDIIFFLLGGGPAATTLSDIVQKEDLHENVVIHNSVNYSDVPQFIEMSDVCILPLPNYPYWRSQSPLKLLEYLAMEKVVILSDIPAHRLVIDNKPCGVFLSSTSPDEIANSILKVYENRDKLSAWGKTGRLTVNESYTWSKVAKEMEAYLFSDKLSA